MKELLIDRLIEGNRRYQAESDAAIREKTALEGQKPWAIVVSCSDSRVIPEEIFHASLGELFVIRVAGNVLDDHQLGSVEYAAGHLGCSLVILLGHALRRRGGRSQGRGRRLYQVDHRRDPARHRGGTRSPGRL